MKTTIHIENLKCHGCANTIRRNILAIRGVKDVIVIHDDPSVEIEYEGGEEMAETFRKTLKKLGYPEKGKNNTGAAVKSYVSCAIGRIKK